MKWYLLVLVMYSSYWFFLGWGIDGNMLILITSLLFFLISILVTIFCFKKNVQIREGLCLFFVPCMIVYTIVKNFGSLDTWKVVLIVLATIFQAILLFLYFKAKKRKAIKE